MQHNNQQSVASALTLQDAEHREFFRTFLVEEECAERKILENFISETFAEHYEAKLLNFYPHLMGAYDDQQQPYAAIGYRKADEQALFLEQYLDQSIESLLLNYPEEKSQNTLLQRKHIVEIGNLATSKRGACQHLFQLLAQFFHQSQLRWVVFTGTRTVRLLVKRLRLKTYELSKASAQQLEMTSLDSWGHYYEQQPVVMAIPVNQSLSDAACRYRMTTSLPSNIG